MILRRIASGGAWGEATVSFYRNKHFTKILNREKIKFWRMRPYGLQKRCYGHDNTISTVA